MRNFLLGFLFAAAVAWIALTGFYSYQCLGASGSEWLWSPMSMGLTEYWQRVDSTWACTLDHVAEVAGREAVYYYWNFPSAVIGLTMLVLLGPWLFHRPQKANFKSPTSQDDRYKAWRGKTTVSGESADDVRQRAKRRL